MTIDLLAAVTDLTSTLITASFRGVPYQTIDTSTEVGRRVQAFLFPGQDQRQFQDLGAMDGPIRVSGLLAGDDYVAQAAALAGAFRTPGPGTLIDPWLGTLEVVLQAPPSITFKDNELRIARFQATFLPYDPLTPTPPDTLTALLEGAQTATTATAVLLAAYLAPSVIPIAVYSYGQSVATRVQAIWSGLTTGGAGVAPIAAASATSIAALATLPETSAATFGAAAVSALMAVPAAIAAASVPTPPAAVAPGSSSAAPATADPLQTTQLLLGSATSLAVFGSDPAPGAGVAAGLEAASVIAAVQAASDIVYVSQEQAEAMLASLVAAIDTVAAAALALAQQQPLAAGALWRAMMSLRAAVLADMSTLIGRLPPVVNVTLLQPQPAWLLANAIDGDSPGNIFAAYQDIIARNRVANPGLVPGPVIEVLA